MIDKGKSGKILLKELIQNSTENDYLTTEVNYARALMHHDKISCVGLNYQKHADEVKADCPKQHILFNKVNNDIRDNQQQVTITETTERLDYEAELGVVIGKKASNVSETEALDHVFGYCATNDLSARDLQKRTSQWMLGKTSDGLLPIGPYIVTKDEIDDPNNLKIQTKLNDKLVQDSNTSDMIFTVPEIISYISKYMTLKPGDLIITGTPEGVIIGQPKEEREYLKSADKVTVKIEKLGSLTTTFGK